MARAIRNPASEADIGLLEKIESTLYTAVVSDSLDELGFRDQAMREYLRPVWRSKPFAGWARTIACMDLYHIAEDPYGMEIEAVDSILSGEVAVVSTAQSKRNAPWGELLSTAAQVRGGRGAVVDGLVRDIRKIETLGFPVYAAGIKPLDSQGRGIVVDYNVPVECGEVLVEPGDLIFADDDGVIVVPSAVVPQAIELAAAKVARENGTREELLRGGYLRDAFKKYGVL
jgi:regulator of RNase E activity RraA